VTVWAAANLAAAYLLEIGRLPKETMMPRFALAMLACLPGMLACLPTSITLAQTPAPTPAPPLFATTKVEGTDNVYIFRYQGHQAMFIVTPAGVIATDPIGRYRPQAVTAYIDEIRKITSAPIRYVVYSHHHYDHIAGGKPFKDAGATFVAHKRAKERLAELNFADITPVDEAVDKQRSIELGGTTLELIDVGRNHSDTTLLMRLPREKLIFAVDFLPINSVNWRNMPDSWPIEWEDGIKKVLALEWDRMIPGHPGPGGRLGTRDDVSNLLAYMQDLREEVKKAADAGKCIDTAMREVKLPKYATLTNYENWLPMNVERYCLYYSGGM
jgi:glyoxylase-like metal-dependent hydrolase (beta-lactamase superfamily II)